MIALVIFALHIVGLAGAFTRRWQEEGWGEGLLAVFFMGLIFFVGWSITSFVAKLLIDQEGFGPWLDRDAFSLLLLTLAESVFYFVFLRNWNPAPAGKDSDSSDKDSPARPSLKE
jgi:hypothetical protein